jgi:integrase
MGRTGSGVELRDTSIRIKFVLDGETIRERLTVNGKSMLPTPANIKYATRLSAQVQQAIATNTFSFERFFPESKRAKVEVPAEETFGKAADTWLATQGRLSDATKDQYGTACRFWKKLLGEKVALRSITHKDLASKIGSYPWPSGKTHNNYMIALRGIMELEYRGADSVHNPVNGIENMSVVKKLPDPLTTDERNAILDVLQDKYDIRVYAYFLFMFFTGMRPEEAIALRWSDIDWKNQIARVQRVRTFKGSERDGSKTHAVRDVDLVPQAVQALMLMKPFTFMLATERDGDEDTSADIFQNPNTRRPWHDERSQRDHYWKPTLKKLGIRWRRPYNTRHTFATSALMTGAPPAYIADQLGHSLKMLLERYARWIPANDKGSAKAMLAAAMGGSQPTLRRVV